MALLARLDLLGGISGDMFAAAMLDTFPDLEEGLNAAMAALKDTGFGGIKKTRMHDGVFDALSLDLVGPDRHEHRNWQDIKTLFAALDIEEKVKNRALEIFTPIAEAEAAVHALPLSDVHFHEVGAWDSIADILMAAWLIEHCGVTKWSCGPIPIGQGEVMTRHGRMPVPAPATVHLLQGFSLIDDGISGERVTPTGAAILKYIINPGHISGKLIAEGHGRGSRELDGKANILRILVFEEANTASDRLTEIAFEIDDQSPEDLALGLEHIRCADGVRDVLQFPGFGKKGRMVTCIRILVEEQYSDEVASLCFTQTTSLGLRRTLVERLLLQRKQVGDVKLAFRPEDEVTGKAEIDAAKGKSAFERHQNRFRQVNTALQTYKTRSEH